MQVDIPQYSWLNLTDLLESNGITFWDHTEFPDVPISVDDKYIQLTQEQAKRIDLIAYDYYGNSDIFWVILLANDIQYPNQLVEGLQIRLPAIATIDAFLKPNK